MDSEAPKIDFTADRVLECVMQLATDGWRFSRQYLSVLQRDGSEDLQRRLAPLRYYRRQLTNTLSDLGFEVVDLENHPYNAGQAVSALNLSEFGPSDLLVIDQMLEPIILRDGRVVKQGTVTLRRHGE